MAYHAYYDIPRSAWKLTGINIREGIGTTVSTNLVTALVFGASLVLPIAKSRADIGKHF